MPESISAIPWEPDGILQVRVPSTSDVRLEYLLAPDLRSTLVAGDYLASEIGCFGVTDSG